MHRGVHVASTWTQCDNAQVTMSLSACARICARCLGYARHPQVAAPVQCSACTGEDAGLNTGRHVFHREDRTSPATLPGVNTQNSTQAAINNRSRRRLQETVLHREQQQRPCIATTPHDHTWRTNTNPQTKNELPLPNCPRTKLNAVHLAYSNRHIVRRRRIFEEIRVRSLPVERSNQH